MYFNDLLGKTTTDRFWNPMRVFERVFYVNDYIDYNWIWKRMIITTLNLTYLDFVYVVNDVGCKIMIICVYMYFRACYV